MGAGATTVGFVPLAACGGDDAFVVGEPDGSLATYSGPPHEDASFGTTDAAYGGPHPEINDANAGQDAFFDGPEPTVDAAYGAPPPHDAGVDASDADAAPEAADAADADTD